MMRAAELKSVDGFESETKEKGVAVVNAEVTRV